MSVLWTFGMGPWNSSPSGWTIGKFGLVMPLAINPEIDPDNVTYAVNSRFDTEIPLAIARGVTMRLQEPSEASFQVITRADMAPKVTAGVDDVWIARNDDDIFRGRVTKARTSINENTCTVDITAVDYRGLMDRQPSGTPYRASDYTVTKGTGIYDAFVNRTAAAQLALGLITPDNPGDLGTVKVDTEFSYSDTSWAAVEKLLESSNGFDFWVDKYNRMHLVKERGGFQGVVLDYGGLVKAANINYDMAEYANAIQQFGAEKYVYSGTERYLPGQTLVSTQGQYPEGQWMTIFEDSNLINPAMVTSAARAHLDELSVLRPTVEVELRPGVWQGLGHINLGDTVRVWVKTGDINEDFYARVMELQVDINEDGFEDVKMVLTRPKRSLVRLLQEANRALKRNNYYGKGTSPYYN